MALETEDSLHPLMGLALGGDAKAYHRVLKALRPILSRYFNRRLGDGQSDDLVQQTLITIHEKRHTYDKDRPFLPWVMAVARHKLIDEIRRTKRRVFVTLEDDLQADDFNDALCSKRDLAALLAHLPKDQARMIHLSKIDEQPLEDVSKAMDKSLSAIKVGIHRGLIKLKALVGDAPSLSSTKVEQLHEN